MQPSPRKSHRSTQEKRALAGKKCSHVFLPAFQKCTNSLDAQAAVQLRQTLADELFGGRAGPAIKIEFGPIQSGEEKAASMNCQVKSFTAFPCPPRRFGKLGRGPCNQLRLDGDHAQVVLCVFGNHRTQKTKQMIQAAHCLQKNVVCYEPTSITSVLSRKRGVAPQASADSSCALASSPLSL